MVSEPHSTADLHDGDKREGHKTNGGQVRVVEQGQEGEHTS